MDYFYILLLVRMELSWKQICINSYRALFLWFTSIYTFMLEWELAFNSENGIPFLKPSVKFMFILQRFIWQKTVYTLWEPYLQCDFNKTIFPVITHLGMLYNAITDCTLKTFSYKKTVNLERLWFCLYMGFTFSS